MTVISFATSSMIFVLLLFPLLASSHVVRYDVSITEKASFSFQTVCTKSYKVESPLIEVLSGSEIDCMGRKTNATDFCARELSHDPYLLRGEVDAVKRQIHCTSGRKAHLKYQCVKLSDRALCQDAKRGCQEMQRKLARRLDIVHSSVTKNDKGISELNCYFESLPLNERTKNL